MKKHYKTLPKLVKIGSRSWTITVANRDIMPDHVHGFTVTNLSSNIVLRHDYPDIEHLRALLTHEIMHAIRLSFEPVGSELSPRAKKESYEDYADRWEHYFISIYERNFISVVRDNPDLKQFLFGE